MQRYLNGLGLLLAAWLTASVSHAQVSLEQGLLRQAPRIIQYCQDKGYKNIGVLKFLVSRAGQPFTDNVGTLNLLAARRLELALILANDPKTPIGIIENASDIARTIGGASHLTMAGRVRLFAAQYPLAWGKDLVQADAFITGTTEISKDLRTLTVSLYGLDRGTNKLTPLGDDFNVANAPDRLAEMGESFVLRGVFDGGNVEAAKDRPKLAEKVYDEAIHVHDGKVKHPALQAGSYVTLHVLYDGKKVPLEFRDGKAFIREPRQGQTVAFEMSRDAGKERYGVVLKVNGVNTLLKQRGPDGSCLKWILDPMEGPWLVEGYQVSRDRRESFRVSSAPVSREREVQYGSDVGTITMTVYREQRGQAKPRLQELDEQYQTVVSKVPYLPERSNNYHALKARLLEDANRGLVEGGPVVQGNVNEAAFRSDPDPIMSMTIVYYKTGGSPDGPEAAAVKIQPGSALAQLIAEAEAHPVMKIANARVTNSGVRIRSDAPPWLRAQYMRNHPQVKCGANAKDITGGYPLVLENLHVWMLLNQDLRRTAPPAFAPARLVEAADGNIRVSGQNTAPLSEVDIRVNFRDPKKLIAAANNIGGGGGQAQFFSTDGGLSWGQTNLPIIAGDSFHSDPTVDWTSDGTAWATTIGISAGSTTLQMRSYKSVDDGKTWTFDATFSGDQTSADKQQMWVDRSANSPFRDTIHVIWHNDNPAFVNRRTPTGGFQAPLQVSGAETTGTAIGSDITTNARGEVFAVWPDTGSQNLFFIKSIDGGATYSRPRAIAKTFASFQITVPAFAKREALVGASIAAFRAGNRNDVYVSWIDLSGEAGCNQPTDEPKADVNSRCKSRVWFVRSTDGGVTWGDKYKINDLPDLSDQFTQKLAVDPDTGLLGIAYYNSGTGEERKKTDVFFQFSVNNGASFVTPATQVTTAKTDETVVNADLGNQYGDYIGMSVVNGVFFPCWTDRRDNLVEATFTARIGFQNRNGVLTPTLTAGR